MRGLGRKLYLERRRLLVVMVLTFIGGCVWLHTSAPSLFGLPLWLVGGIAFSLGLTVFLMAIVLIVPSARFTVESAAFAVAPVGLINWVADFQDHGHISNMALIAGVVIAILSGQVYGGQWLDRFVPAQAAPYRSRATSRMTPAELWPFLLPTPDNAQQVQNEDILEIEWLEPGRSFRQKYRFQDVATIEEVINLDTYEPHALMQFRWQAQNADPKAHGSSGAKEISVKPYVQGSIVTTIRRPDHSSWRNWLVCWVDDAFSRTDDLKLAEAERSVLAAKTGEISL